jgi:hypothetical protein
VQPFGLTALSMLLIVAAIFVDTSNRAKEGHA